MDRAKSRRGERRGEKHGKTWTPSLCCFFGSRRRSTTQAPEHQGDECPTSASRRRRQETSRLRRGTETGPTIRSKGFQTYGSLPSRPSRVLLQPPKYFFDQAVTSEGFFRTLPCPRLENSGSAGGTAICSALNTRFTRPGSTSSEGCSEEVFRGV